MSSTKITTIRDGNEEEIFVEDIVLDDIIKLKAGIGHILYGCLKSISYQKYMLLKNV